MTLFTEGSALAAGHRNVRTVTADVGDELGIEPGTADLVVASCIANNMLNEIAGHCTRGDTDTVGYARWYHAWDTRPLPLLEQARRLLRPAGSWSPSSTTITSSASAPGAGCSPARASRSSLS